MNWLVEFHDDFRSEFDNLSADVQNAIAIGARVLEMVGPELGRPDVDTLKGSRFANMKELRFNADGSAWRAAFAFDPRRRAILLVAASKSGISQRLFYKRLIEAADRRFKEHLATLTT